MDDTHYVDDFGISKNVKTFLIGQIMSHGNSGVRDTTGSSATTNCRILTVSAGEIMSIQKQPMEKHGITVRALSSAKSAKSKTASVECSPVLSSFIPKAWNAMIPIQKYTAMSGS